MAESDFSDRLRRQLNEVTEIREREEAAAREREATRNRAMEEQEVSRQESLQLIRQFGDDDLRPLANAIQAQFPAGSTQASLERDDAGSGWCWTYFFSKDLIMLSVSLGEATIKIEVGSVANGKWFKEHKIIATSDFDKADALAWFEENAIEGAAHLKRHSNELDVPVVNYKPRSGD